MDKTEELLQEVVKGIVKDTERPKEKKIRGEEEVSIVDREIKDIKRQFLLTTEEFAPLIGVDRATIYRLETGELKLRVFQEMLVKTMKLAISNDNDILYRVRKNYPSEWSIAKTLAAIFQAAYPT